MLSVASVLLQNVKYYFFICYISQHDQLKCYCFFLCQKSVYLLQNRNLHLCYPTSVTKSTFKSHRTKISHRKNKKEIQSLEVSVSNAE